MPAQKCGTVCIIPQIAQKSTTNSPIAHKSIFTMHASLSFPVEIGKSQLWIALPWFGIRTSTSAFNSFTNGIPFLFNLLSYLFFETTAFCQKPSFLLAERVGFEPTVGCPITSFQDWLLKPLGHLSMGKMIPFRGEKVKEISKRKSSQIVLDKPVPLC